MENEEGNTASPEKYWLDRWEEKMEGDQVTEVGRGGIPSRSSRKCNIPEEETSLVCPGNISKLMKLPSREMRMS